MNDTTPSRITKAEWRELARVPELGKCLGDRYSDWTDDERGELLADCVYGVKFRDFATGSPGYAGVLYLLHTGGIASDPPVPIIRDPDTGKLVNAIPWEGFYESNG